MARFEYKSINGLNFILIHDVLSPSANDNVWTIFNYAKDHFRGPEGTGSAKSQDGTFLKKNRGIFLNELFPRPFLCDEVIVSMNTGIQETLPSLPSDSVFRCYESANWHAILMQYYLKDGEHYDAHKDSCMFTAVMFFNQEPINFKGGDLLFPEHNVIVPFKNNCCIVFPSTTLHKVCPVEQIDKNVEVGGRLTVTVLAGISPVPTN